MKSRMRIALAGLAVLLLASVTGVALATQPEPEKVVKQYTGYGDIQGSIQGLGKGEHTIQLELFRRENDQLTPVATVTTKGNGDFLFPDLIPGEYVITPDLASLPDGVGLYRRHVSLLVHQEVARVAFTAGQIQRLEINRGKEIAARAGDTVHVETAAYDRAGEYLFAPSEITVPLAEMAVTANSANGKSLRLTGAGRALVVRAKNGQASATVTVKAKAE